MFEVTEEAKEQIKKDLEKLDVDAEIPLIRLHMAVG